MSCSFLPEYQAKVEAATVAAENQGGRNDEA